MQMAPNHRFKYQQIGACLTIRTYIMIVMMKLISVITKKCESITLEEISSMMHGKHGQNCYGTNTLNKYIKAKPTK